MKPLCVIPARAGSKRLAGKNVAMLGGKPLIAWTIDAARDSGIFDKIYVSTESDEIAALAARCGGDVSIRRPAQLAGDEVSNVQVSLHLLDALARTGYHYDVVVCLQPSSPLRNGNDIAGAWQRFQTSQQDFLGSITPLDAHFFHWAVEKKPEGSYGLYFGEQFLKARQHLPQYFRLNGAIKIARADALRRVGQFFSDRFDGYAMEEERSVHVATAVDLALCEAILRWTDTDRLT